MITGAIHDSIHAHQPCHDLPGSVLIARVGLGLGLGQPFGSDVHHVHAHVDGHLEPRSADGEASHYEAP